MENRPNHNRITYLLGSSTSKEIMEDVQRFIVNKNQIMVILDSDHKKEHVLSELRIYSQFVTKGSYIIVEDTNINSHPIFPDFGPGPMEAVKDFLEENKDFVIDKSREKFYLTFNPLFQAGTFPNSVFGDKCVPFLISVFLFVKLFLFINISTYFLFITSTTFPFLCPVSTYR